MHSEIKNSLIKTEAEFQKVINGGLDSDLIEGRANMLHNKSFTDVTFIVGPPSHSKKYVGHRVLLAMTSPVFERLFYGEMADKNKVIRIPDLAPIGFENLLRYAYTDSLNLSNVEDAMLTAYASKKYLLPHLLRECLTYIGLHVSPNTACAVYEFAVTINSSQLMFQALQLIDRQTYHVITHKSFNSIQPTTMELIASRRYLNLYSEYSLFNAIIQWAIAEAKRRQYNFNDWLIIRSILQDSNILKYIRLLTMTQEEFCRVVAQTTSSISNTLNTGQSGKIFLDKQDEQFSSPSASNQILSVMLSDNSFFNKVEQVAIFMNLSIPGIILLPKGFSSNVNPRQVPPEYFVVSRFKPITYSTTGNFILNSTSKLGTVYSKFQVHNSDIFIIGASIPIRLDSTYFSMRTPKLECQLRFSSKNPSEAIAPLNEDISVLDTIDDTITIAICKEKDCIVRLKKPIFVKKGNYNELTLTFPSTSLIDDILLIKGHRNKIFQNDIIDGENISWMFTKTNNIEFNELYYYY